MMYHFIFYFIYKAKIKADGPKVTRYSASLIVSIFLGMHLGLLYCIARFICCYFWQISIARSNPHATASDTLSDLLIINTILFLSYKYFNEQRVNTIVEKYQGKEKFFTAVNIIKFILLFFAPLLIAIFFENKSVTYCIV